MIKRLNLKPSARDKRRYFIVSQNDKKVKEAILKYLGILGMAKAAYVSVKVPELKGKHVGSCLRKELDNIRAGLILARIRVEKVSNTIKGLSK